MIIPKMYIACLSTVIVEFGTKPAASQSQCFGGISATAMCSGITIHLSFKFLR